LAVQGLRSDGMMGCGREVGRRHRRPSRDLATGRTHRLIDDVAAKAAVGAAGPGLQSTFENRLTLFDRMMACHPASMDRGEKISEDAASLTTEGPRPLACGRSGIWA